jgi:transcriptional regulator with XRE-family HTH domain
MVDNALNTTGKRMKHLREKLRLSQEEVAARCGISQSAYNRYEKDQIRRFTRANLDKLALALESTPEFILGINEEGSPDVRLAHIPDYLQQFIRDPNSLRYIAEAYLKYQQDRVAETLKKE